MMVLTSTMSVIYIIIVSVPSIDVPSRSSLCFMKWLSIALLMCTIWRIKQFVEVEILENLSCFLLVLLSLIVSLIWSVTSSSSFVWAYSFSNESILFTTGIKLSVFNKFFQAIVATILAAFVSFSNQIIIMSTFEFEFRTLFLIFLA